MHDELIMNNYLMLLKSTVEVYVHGTLESSNKDIRTLLKKGLDETMTHQANTYDIMVDNGWYTINNADTSIIKQTIDNLQCCCDE